MALIFDIETIGYRFDEMDETTKSSLTRWIKREAGDNQNKYNVLFKDLKEGLGFSPLTGEIAVIGVYDTDKNKGVVYYQSPDITSQESRQENFIFKPVTEAEMLQKFWQGTKNYREFVSFNGRSFDVPFLMLRSAAHKIKPTLNLMGKRYLSSYQQEIRHVDLMDQLTFYGAVRRRGSLHLYCQTFGIRSPKDRGITGDDVQRLFEEKKYQEIAEYNSWDLIATFELYQKWLKYVKM